ncbi:MAG TPA: hypothetical protein VEZ88_01490 [Steroidobacteraceae bacterium]|nr:hypothetical protein [Steroidobacteraceae bacterium]
MNTIPLSTEDQPQDENQCREGWDPFQVWSERVCRPRRDAASAPPRGWDPYFVWLSRVRKSAQ